MVSAWHWDPETRLRADASPPTFLVGIFSFKNSASLHSTFQGAWILTNPTPWILVWKTETSSQSAWAGASVENCSHLPVQLQFVRDHCTWRLPPVTSLAPLDGPLRRCQNPLLADVTRELGVEPHGNGEEPEGLQGGPRLHNPWEGLAEGIRAAPPQKGGFHSTGPRPFGLHLGALLSLSRDKEVMVKMAPLGIFPLWGQATHLVSCS